MRWIFRIVFFLLLLVAIAIGAIFLLPSERIARLAETQFLENTGRKLTLSGDVSPQLFPRLGVSLEGVSIANAEWSEDGPLLEADRLELGVGLRSLLSGEIVVEAAEVVAPVIRLERREDGAANWDFITELGGEEESEGGTPDISLPKALLSNGSVTFRDGTTGESYELSDLNVALSVVDLSGPAEVQLDAIMRGQSVSVTGNINTVQNFLDGAVSGLDVNAAIGGASISFAGDAGLEPMQAKGQLDADLADHDALFALIGQSAPVIPAGLGQKARITGELTLADGNALYLRGTQIALDQNVLTGDIDVNFADAPQVTARIQAGDLDFSAMSTDTTEGDGAANAGSGGWSTARLDVSGLDAVNGQLEFRANSVDLGSIKIVNADMRGNLNRSRLVLDLVNVGAFDGSVAGQFVVNGRGGLSVGGDLRASEVAMQRVLADFAGYDRLLGTAQMSLKFLASGESLDQIMKSLSGEGRFDIGSGEIQGLDILGMIRNLDASFEGEGSSTVFDAISGSYAIEGGVLRNSDLDFKAQLLTATGAGALNIGGQSIEYRVDPVALADQTGGFGIPVLIEGPWSNVSFTPDLKALADRELAEEKEKLKAAAKAKEDELKAQAKAKLAEELEVDLGSEANVEDAVKQGLEDRAKDQLRNLFNRSE